MSEAMEREARQRLLIAQALSAYRRRDVTVGRFIQDLEGLAFELRLAPPEWLADFRLELNGLEVLHSVAVDRGVALDLPTGYRADADEMVGRLETLLAQLPPLAPDDAS